MRKGLQQAVTCGDAVTMSVMTRHAGRTRVVETTAEFAVPSLMSLLFAGATTAHAVVTTAHAVVTTAHAVVTMDHAVIGVAMIGLFAVVTTAHAVVTMDHAVATMAHAVATTAHAVVTTAHAVATTAHAAHLLQPRLSRQTGAMRIYGWLRRIHRSLRHLPGETARIAGHGAPPALLTFA